MDEEQQQPLQQQQQQKDNGADLPIFYEKVSFNSYVLMCFRYTCSFIKNIFLFMISFCYTDPEIKDLRWLLLIWEMIVFVKNVFSWAITMDNIAYSVDMLNDIYELENKLVPKGEGYRAWMKLISIIKSQQFLIDGGHFDWSTYFTLKTVWIVFFPYVLKSTILPIFRRLQYNRSNN